MAYLSDHDRRAFLNQGYLHVKGHLDPYEDLGNFQEEYHDLLRGIDGDLVRQGRLPPIEEAPSFDGLVKRLTGVLGGRLHNQLDISLPQKGVNPKTPIHTGPEVFRLITNPRLLDLVEELLGPEILSNPTQHVRIKPPQALLEDDSVITAETATTVWHQDLGTVATEADQTDMITVWIAITEATEENGCLLVAPGSHRRGLAEHLHDPKANYSGQAIRDEEVGAERVALVADPGDVVLLHKLTMHASLPNLSDSVRWSVDLRYQPTGQATGRPWFPEFVARSHDYPQSVLKDAATWTGLWQSAKHAMIETPPENFQRWSKT